jgi:hypothetical protein
LIRTVLSELMIIFLVLVFFYAVTFILGVIWGYALFKRRYKR